MLGVLHNEAARQAIGLWAPLSPHRWLDVAFGLAALALLAGALRARPRRVGARRTRRPRAAHAARRARRRLARALRRAARRGRLRRAGRSERIPRLARPVALALIAAVLLGLAHGPLPSGAGAPLVTRTLALAHGTPVLAEDLLAEQVADAGGRVWVANPIDAFRDSDQRVYVEWLRGVPAATPRSRTPRARCSCAATARPSADCARMPLPPHRLGSRAVLYARIAPDSISARDVPMGVS